ncbi:uncharacterized protein V1518DRAFT_411493 [Limtongia smithiae]|uniref:uncharacterized protein n=1 Tax=Limtongia smithiae TaxID=1125753 RepID=UPI0034CD2C4E
MIKPKGRPVSQCPHCREARKNHALHTKCDCPGDVKHSVKGAANSVSAAAGIQAGVSASISCNCSSGGKCDCSKLKNSGRDGAFATISVTQPDGTVKSTRSRNNSIKSHGKSPYVSIESTASSVSSSISPSVSGSTATYKFIPLPMEEEEIVLKSEAPYRAHRPTFAQPDVLSADVGSGLKSSHGSAQDYLGLGFTSRGNIPDVSQTAELFSNPVTATSDMAYNVDYFKEAAAGSTERANSEINDSSNAVLRLLPHQYEPESLEFDVLNDINTQKDRILWHQQAQDPQSQSHDIQHGSTSIFSEDGFDEFFLELQNPTITDYSSNYGLQLPQAQLSPSFGPQITPLPSDINLLSYGVPTASAHQVLVTSPAEAYCKPASQPSFEYETGQYASRQQHILATKF